MAIEIERAVPMFHVYDVPTSIAFYRDLLGFDVMQHSPPFTSAPDDFGWALLRLNGVDLMLNNMYENNIRPAYLDVSRAASHRDTTLYFHCSDVDSVYAYLRSKDVTAREPFDSHYGLKQVYLHDPDGYTLCFQQSSKA